MIIYSFEQKIILYHLDFIVCFEQFIVYDIFRNIFFKELIKNLPENYYSKK